MKKENKVLALLFISLFLMTILSSVVSAAAPATIEKISTETTNVLENLKAFFKPIISALLGKEEIVSSTLIFLLITFTLIAVVSFIPLFEDKKGLGIIVSIIIAILGVRYLPANIIASIIKPSSTLVAAITILIPFILFGYFVIQSVTSSLLRRSMWIVFASVFTVLLIFNRAKPYDWIYLVAIVGCIVAMAFDGLLQKYFLRARAERRLVGIKEENIHRLENEINELERALANAVDETERRKIERRIAGKKAALTKLLKVSSSL